MVVTFCGGDADLWTFTKGAVMTLYQELVLKRRK
jgi:hypothetical protein